MPAAPTGFERMQVTPDVIRNAVVDSDPAIRDFRVVQTGTNQITVWLADELPLEVDDTTVKCLSARLRALGLAPEVTVARGIDLQFDRKLRRVRREA